MLSTKQRVDKVKLWIQQISNQELFNVTTVYDEVEGVSVKNCTLCSFSSSDDSEPISVSQKYIQQQNLENHLYTHQQDVGEDDQNVAPYFENNQNVAGNLGNGQEENEKDEVVGGYGYNQDEAEVLENEGVEIFEEGMVENYGIDEDGAEDSENNDIIKKLDYLIENIRGDIQDEANDLEMNGGEEIFENGFVENYGNEHSLSESLEEEAEENVENLMLEKNEIIDQNGAGYSRNEGVSNLKDGKVEREASKRKEKESIKENLGRKLGGEKIVGGERNVGERNAPKIVENKVIRNFESGKIVLNKISPEINDPEEDLEDGRIVRDMEEEGKMIEQNFEDGKIVRNMEDEGKRFEKNLEDGVMVEKREKTMLKNLYDDQKLKKVSGKGKKCLRRSQKREKSLDKGSEKKERKEENVGEGGEELREEREVEDVVERKAEELREVEAGEEREKRNGEGEEAEYGKVEGENAEGEGTKKEDEVGEGDVKEERLKRRSKVKEHSKKRDRRRIAASKKNSQKGKGSKKTIFKEVESVSKEKTTETGDEESIKESSEDRRNVGKKICAKRNSQRKGTPKRSSNRTSVKKLSIEDVRKILEEEELSKRNENHEGEVLNKSSDNEGNLNKIGGDVSSNKELSGRRTVKNRRSKKTDGINTGSGEEGGEKDVLKTKDDLETDEKVGESEEKIDFSTNHGNVKRYDCSKTYKVSRTHKITNLSSQGLRVYVNRKKPSWKKFIRTPCSTWTNKSVEKIRKKRTPKNKYLKEIETFIDNLEWEGQVRREERERKRRGRIIGKSEMKIEDGSDIDGDVCTSRGKGIFGGKLADVREMEGEFVGVVGVEDEEHSSDTDWDNRKDIDLRETFVKNRRKFRTRFGLHKTPIEEDGNMMAENRRILRKQGTRRRLLNCTSIWDGEGGRNKVEKELRSKEEGTEYNFEKLAVESGRVLDDLFKKEKRMGDEGGTTKEKKKKKNERRSEGSERKVDNGMEGGVGRNEKEVLRENDGKMVEKNKEGVRRNEKKSLIENGGEMMEENEGRMLQENGQVQQNIEMDENLGQIDKINNNNLENFEIRINEAEIFENEKDVNAPLLDMDGYLTGFEFLEPGEKVENIGGNQVLNKNVVTRFDLPVVLREPVHSKTDLSVNLEENVHSKNDLPVDPGEPVHSKNNLPVNLGETAHSKNDLPGVSDGTAHPNNIPEDVHNVRDNIPVISDKAVLSENIIPTSLPQNIPEHSENPKPVILNKNVQPKKVIPAVLTETVPSENIHLVETNLTSKDLTDRGTSSIEATNNKKLLKSRDKNGKNIGSFQKNFEISSVTKSQMPELRVVLTRCDELLKKNDKKGEKRKEKGDKDEEGVINEVEIEKKCRVSVTKSNNTSKQEKFLAKYVARIKKASHKARRYRKLKVQVVKSEKSMSTSGKTSVFSEKIVEKKFNMTRFSRKSLSCSSGWADYDERLKQIDVQSCYTKLKVVKKGKIGENRGENGVETGENCCKRAGKHGERSENYGKRSRCDGRVDRKMKPSAAPIVEGTQDTVGDRKKRKDRSKQNKKDEGEPTKKLARIDSHKGNRIGGGKNSRKSNEIGIQIEQNTRDVEEINQGADTFEETKNEENTSKRIVGDSLGERDKVIKTRKIVEQKEDSNFAEKGIFSKNDVVINHENSDKNGRNIDADGLEELQNDIVIVQESLDVEAQDKIDKNIGNDENREMAEKVCEYQIGEHLNLEEICSGIMEVDKNSGSNREKPVELLDENLEIIESSLNLEAQNVESEDWLIENSAPIENCLIPIFRPNRKNCSNFDGKSVEKNLENVSGYDEVVLGSRNLGSNVNENMSNSCGVNQFNDREELNGKYKEVDDNNSGISMNHGKNVENLGTKQGTDDYLEIGKRHEIVDRNEEIGKQSQNNMEFDNIRQINREFGMDERYESNSDCGKAYINGTDNMNGVKNYVIENNRTVSNCVTDNFGTRKISGNFEASTYETIDSCGSSNRFGEKFKKNCPNESNMDENCGKNLDSIDRYEKLLEEDEEFFTNENLMTFDSLNNMEGDIEFNELEIQLEGDLIEEFCDMLQDFEDDERFDRNLLKSFVRNLRGSPVRKLAFDTKGNVLVDGVVVVPDVVEESGNLCSMEMENRGKVVEKCGGKMDRFVQTAGTQERSVFSGNLTGNSRRLSEKMRVSSGKCGLDSKILSGNSSRMSENCGSSMKNRLENSSNTKIPPKYRGFSAEDFEDSLNLTENVVSCGQPASNSIVLNSKMCTAGTSSMKNRLENSSNTKIPTKYRGFSTEDFEDSQNLTENVVSYGQSASNSVLNSSDRQKIFSMIGSRLQSRNESYRSSEINTNNESGEIQQLPFVFKGMLSTRVLGELSRMRMLKFSN